MGPRDRGRFFYKRQPLVPYSLILVGKEREVFCLVGHFLKGYGLPRQSAP